MKTLKRTLCLVLVAVMALGLFAVAASAKKLSDYDDAAAVSSEYQVAVDVATQLGILEGMGADTYGAKGTLTRAQLATMLYRMVTGDVAKKYVANYAGGAAFTDVKADAWYAGYVNYSADKGLLAGVGNNKYDPNSALTGYQTLAAFLRALGYGKNGEFVGADWKAGVTMYADKIDGEIVADWSKPITREVAAQLIYNTLKAETVNYVFGQYVGTKSTLAKSVFGATLIVPGKVDDFGTPGEVWYAGKTAIVKAAYPFVKSYTTAVTECDVLVDLGVAKTDLTTSLSFSRWDGGDVTVDFTMKHDSACATNVYGGQGVLTSIYQAAPKTYIITQNTTYLAKVTKVSPAAHGAAAYSEVELYACGGAIADVKVADVVSYEKGTYVLVTSTDLVIDHAKRAVNLPASYTATIIGVAPSAVAKLTAKSTVSSVVTYTVGSGSYKESYHYHYDYETAPVVGETYTWYFDQYGNIIGSTDAPAVAKTYAVIEGIKWIHTASVKGDYAAADVVYMDAKIARDSKVTKVGGKAVSNKDAGGSKYFATVSDNASLNGDYYGTLVTVADGLELTYVGTNKDNADIKKGDPTITWGWGWYADEVEADAKTVYLMKYFDTTGDVAYAQYIGFAAMPSVDDAEISYVMDADGKYVDYIFVDATEAQILDTVANASYAFVTSAAYDEDEYVSGSSVVKVYTYTAWIGGQKATFKSTSKLTLDTNELYKFVVGSDGMVATYGKVALDDPYFINTVTAVGKQGVDTVDLTLYFYGEDSYNATGAVVYQFADGECTTSAINDVVLSEITSGKSVKAYIDDNNVLVALYVY